MRATAAVGGSGCIGVAGVAASHITGLGPMARDPSSTKHRVDRDGVKLVGTRGPAVGWLLVSALALLGVAAWVVVRATGEDGTSRAPAGPPPPPPGDAPPVPPPRPPRPT